MYDYLILVHVTTILFYWLKNCIKQRIKVVSVDIIKYQ